MEINENKIDTTDDPSKFISVPIKEEFDERDSEFNEIEVITAAQHFCAIEIEESQGYVVNNENRDLNAIDVTPTRITNNNLCLLDSQLNDSQGNDSCDIDNVLTNSIYLSTLDAVSINEEIQKQTSQNTEENLIDQDERTENIPTISVPNEFLDGINLHIKKKDDTNNIYVNEWSYSLTENNHIRLKITNGSKSKGPINIETVINSTRKLNTHLGNGRSNFKKDELKIPEKSKKRSRLKQAIVQDYKDKLKKKAECMREKRKKIYEQESEEERLQRLAKEAAKRREMRMYYETPEQRRKRLDAEAARKREYRMYNETPEDRRKRLDREAERRRMKRLSLYASETPEQRRERLNRESAKRREARLNQYAKETDEQRRERLKRDALRAREMRFTRSAVETDEERRQRLVKDALRKKEVRMHGAHSANNNFTELQTVRNFEELNNVQIKDNPDNQLGGHYLSNWMMWFQNTLAQPVHVGDHNLELQSQDSG